MRPADLLRYVIEVSLAQLARLEPRLDGTVPRALMLGTAMVESNLQYLQQVRGPAMGLWQVEPRTHADCWQNFLAFRPDMHAAFRELCVFDPSPEEMRWNLLYGCAMARLVYWRAPEALPDLDAYGLAGYHERHFNTERGALGRTKELEAVGTFRLAMRYVQ